MEAATDFVCADGCLLHSSVKSVIIFIPESGPAMSINKCFFDFHLLEEGWLSTPADDEGCPPKSEYPSESIVTLRMVEFTSDDKPDIWYKAEIAHIDSNKAKVAELVSKYGLPKAILVNCSSEKQELEQLFARFV